MAAPGFFVSWVLVDQLALGPAPRSLEHLNQLAAAGIKAVLSLCSEQEVATPVQLGVRFRWARQVLPDHRSEKLLQRSDLELALARLEALRGEGPVFVHCVAAMERSPLVCMAWLMQHQGLSRQRALEYLMQVHRPTNPLPQQLALLEGLANSGRSSPF